MGFILHVQPLQSAVTCFCIVAYGQILSGVTLFVPGEWLSFEPPHDKTNKVTVRPAKTQLSLGIRSVWSESSLSAWRNLESLATQWAHSEDFD